MFLPDPHPQPDGHQAKLYSRSGEDITGSFPDLVDALVKKAAEISPVDAVIDGELLVIREGRVAPFSALQKRLNRKKVSKALIAECPVGIRAYDLLFVDEQDMRMKSVDERRVLLSELIAGLPSAPVSLSAIVTAQSWEEADDMRCHPHKYHKGEDASAIEGLMLKAHTSLYKAGRVKGAWYKWKQDPFLIDAVLMYAQRGHGKRSSYYSDFTFGVWTEDAQLTPVGKAYFGFSDAELTEIDRFVRNNTINRFGPVREVTHNEVVGMVFEIAFEGLSRSPRHKSGVAMRFPRIHRIRWDKPCKEADHLDTLLAMIAPKSF